MARASKKAAPQPATLDRAVRLIARTHLDLTALVGLWHDHLLPEQRAALLPVLNRLTEFLAQHGWDQML